MTASVLSVVLVAASLLGWFALAPATRALFTLPQVATLVGIVFVMLGFMMSLGLSRVVVEAAGLTIRNGLRTHRVPWSRIRGFRFTEHDPWAYVLLDGEPDRRPLLGIQRTDHERAEAMVASLRERLALS